MKNRTYQKDTMLNLRLTKGQKDALDYVADQIHGLPTSVVLREVVKQYIATLEKEGFFTDYAKRQSIQKQYEPEVKRAWVKRTEYDYV